MPRRISGSTINTGTAIENKSCYASQNAFDNCRIEQPRLHLHTLDERVHLLNTAISFDQARNYEKHNASEGT